MACPRSGSVTDWWTAVTPAIAATFAAHEEVLRRSESVGYDEAWRILGSAAGTRLRLRRTLRASGDVAMHRDAEIAFREYVDATKMRHFRVAVLLCGNEHDAEDLVQHAYIQLYLRWQAVVKRGSPDAYVRKTITNKLIDLRRSAYHRHEERTAEVPDAPANHELIEQLVADRQQLSDALAQLPTFHRAVLVLRWYEQLTVEETADALDCSTSRVKRGASAALLQMRDLLGAGG